MLGCAGTQLRGCREMQEAITPIIRAALVEPMRLCRAPIGGPHKGIDEAIHGHDG
jgi:hypothetical protein